MSDERRSDRWVSIVLSVLLHGALVGALAYGVWAYRSSQPPKPTLAIEATVVDARAVKGAAIPAPPAPAPPPPAAPQPQPQPAVESEGPPQPTPEELAQRTQAQKEREEKAAAEAKRQEEERQAQEEARRVAEQQRQEGEKAESQRKAQEQAKAEAEAKKKAEERRLAEQKRLEQEKRKAQEAQERTQGEADLKRSLDAEEKQNAAARASGAMASWQSQITARIQRAWIQPPTARAGIQCEVLVTQVPGGTVTNARVGTCNGDAAVRESIESAVFRASPLPPPPDPSLFQSQLLTLFTPN